MGKAASKVLQEIGWNKGYVHDASEDIEVLQKHGFVVHDSAARFLKKYGGLVIKKTSAWPFGSTTSSGDTVRIGVEDCEVLGRIRHEAKSLENSLERGFCLVGTYLTSGDLFCTKTGKIYGVWEDFVWLLGDDEEEAMENICRGKVKKSI